jgi:signal transduction histidine kinase
VSSWLALRVTRPVQGLRDQVDRIARGDFVHVAVPPADDELRDLAIAVNHMIDMLARSEERVRRQERLRTLDRLGGGIAHQLRNAVTGCRMAVDLHRRSCPQRDDESLAVATQQLDSMEEYLRRFLALGQRPAAPRCPVDLREAVTHVLPLVRPRAAHLQVTLECHLPAMPLVIHGHAEALSQAVANLLLNAIEAAAQAGAPSSDGAARRVRVAVAPSSTTMARLEVWDTGNGPSEEIAQQLFEALVSAKPDGVGLGLAIAKEVADDHGGTICWYRRDNMTCFCMELPQWAAEAKNV